MQFINIIAIFLGFLGLAFAQDAAIVSSSTETHTRTIRVSQISTITSLISTSSAVATPSANSTISSTTLTPSSTQVSLSASAPIGTGGVAPTSSISPPIPTDFAGAAPALSVFGAAGVVAMAFVAML